MTDDRKENQENTPGDESGMIFQSPYRLPKDQAGSAATRPAPVRKLREELLKSYRAANPGVLDQVGRTASGFDSNQLFQLILEDLMKSTEDLQGTSLMLEEEGNLVGASGVLIKRADLLRAVIDIVAKKKEMNQRSGELDLNSPAFQEFQKLCFTKMAEALDDLHFEKETVVQVISRWQEKMGRWDKDLKEALAKLDE